jgi:hypothetical protein
MIGRLTGTAKFDAKRIASANAFGCARATGAALLVKLITPHPQGAERPGA